MPTRRLLLAALNVGAAALLALAAGCDSSTTEPASADLVGTWDLISMTDSVTVGATTGSMVFTAGGAFTLVGTVTYPGDAPESINVAGTYAQSGNTATLTIAGGAPLPFLLTFSGSEVVFSPTGSGNISFRLRRHT